MKQKFIKIINSWTYIIFSSLLFLSYLLFNRLVLELYNTVYGVSSLILFILSILSHRLNEKISN